jgi:hypothetical protein
MKETATYDDAMAGATVAVQTFGDFKNFNPHLYINNHDPPSPGPGTIQDFFIDESYCHLPQTDDWPI